MTITMLDIRRKIEEIEDSIVYAKGYIENIYARQLELQDYYMESGMDFNLGSELKRLENLKKKANQRVKVLEKKRQELYLRLEGFHYI